MASIIPEPLKHLLSGQYLAGVAAAEAKYRFNAGDEDALTGALGAEIVTPHPMILRDGTHTYRWETTYYKLRGRGSAAPEKLFGADGIFQIEVYDGKTVRRKGLPFQAKHRWRHKDRKLVEQCRNMLVWTASGIAIDYTDKGYGACRATDVIECEGIKVALRKKGKLESLGQILANDFLDCDIGTPDLFYDLTTERFTTLPDIQADIQNVVQTTIAIDPAD
ncbi:MAG: hypothetical protein AB1586_04385 [Pseudomonadota bacterium]